MAEEGYAGASLARIAQRAGISKSVLLYHFSGKNALLETTVTQIYGEIWDYLRPGFEQETTARGQLLTYIAAEFTFMAQNRTRLLALSYLLTNHRDRDGVLYLREQAEKAYLQSVGKILEQGQQNGEFRDFALQPMAATLMHAINGALEQWVAHPELSLHEYERELVTTFDLATRKQPGS
ncbi:MAG: TetR family transcriptional regulator [Puniceicoccaceae bacterium 5H]|nr:MAG: TetR family transcriptional regulator [Puniceicoccaceae bacterium 5H]